MISPKEKYRPFPRFYLPSRRWPDNSLIKAPTWCSVDLRDGNQALPEPMSVFSKLQLFNAIVHCGFKEVEVGFPAASETEYNFIRQLIENNLIPGDVTIQVLTQAKEDMIEKTVESVVGAKRVIIHLYNSTSPAQRRTVFRMSRREVIKLAEKSTHWIKERLPELKGTDVRFQYSPESFSATEPSFALEICEAVMDAWGSSKENPTILNLPETVEVATPNVYADQIEWFCNSLYVREKAIISVHTHNDRGTGVAATELALLAGAERVEGTLFGNGERTGNADIVTLALNLHSQGIDCGLDLGDINGLRSVYEHCTGREVNDRHPYVGDLVFTALSGTHQDAISKGLKGWKDREVEFWDVPYLPIDPHDIGRSYRGVIRINSQSGKGGIAYILEKHYGLELPREMQKEFGRLAYQYADSLGREISVAEINELFRKEYLDREGLFALLRYDSERVNGCVRCRAVISYKKCQKTLVGKGNGPIAAFVNAIVSGGLPKFELSDYKEQAIGKGAEASAISYILIRSPKGKEIWGASIDVNIEQSSIKAVVSALNKM